MKTNIKGRTCADWCETDHTERRVCQAADRPISTPEGLTTAAVTLTQWPSDQTPDLAAYAHGDGSSADMGSVRVSNAYDAAQLAKLADRLAETAPEQIREFGAQIRAAAEHAWPELEPEAGLCRPRRISGRTGM